MEWIRTSYHRTFLKFQQPAAQPEALSSLGAYDGVSA